MTKEISSVNGAVKKKSAAKARFDETMTRCDGLIALYESTKNDDLLRAVVVLGVAALERYLKDRFLKLFIPFLKKELKKESGWNKSTRKLLKDSGVDEDFWRASALSQTRNVFAKISAKVRAYVRNGITLQQKKKIEHLYTCYGMANIIQDAVGKAERKRLWQSVNKLIRRRHQVAHQADYLNAGKLDEIGEKEIEMRLGHVRKLVDSINDVLCLRFKKKAARKTRKEGKIRNERR